MILIFSSIIAIENRNRIHKHEDVRQKLHSIQYWSYNSPRSTEVGNCRRRNSSELALKYSKNVA